MKKFFGKKRAIALAAVAVLVVAVAAIAYFTSTGTSSTTGTVGTATNWTVSPAANSGDAALYPGSGLQTFGGSVTNAGSGQQFLTQVKVTIAAPTVASGAAVVAGHACSAGDFKLVAPTTTNWIVAADGLSATYAVGSDLAGTNPGPAGSINWNADKIGLTMIDHSYNQDNCQGATPNLTFDAS